MTIRRRLAPSAPDGNFLVTTNAPRQHQVCDIRTGNQQDQADCAHKYQQRPPHVAHDLLMERNNAERQLAVGRIDLGMLANESCSQDIEFRLRLAQWRAGFQLRQDVVILGGSNLGCVGRER